MARKSSNEPPPTPPSVGAAAGKRILSKLSGAATAWLNAGSVSEVQLETWSNQCKDALVRIFGSDSGFINQFIRTGGLLVLTQSYSEAWWSNRRLKELREKNDTIEQFIGVLGAQIEEEELSSPATISSAPQASVVVSGAVPSRDVFIVHGHDDAIKTKVARVLEKLDFKPIILHEQADQGMTIIEKLEKHGANAAFAVVLLTPDDVGSKKGEPNQKLRARQNVILELGYFIGKLGRKHVCAIYSDGVELPSDFGSVGYTPLDAHDAWETKLARELRAAGLAVDMNKL